MRIRDIIISIFIGSVGSGAIFAATLATGNGKVVSALLLSGTPTAYVIDHILPSSFCYWLVPEGGGPAAPSVPI
jgi:hypothetical protein